MKRYHHYVLLLAVFILISPPILLSAHGDVEIGETKDSVVQVDGFQKLFQYENFYLSAQPNIKLLQYAKRNGVDLVINLRSENEMKKYSESSYDEEKIVTEMDMAYKQIPIGGMQSYTPETLNQFATAMSGSKGRVLIHCAGCGRVTHMFMAYLIKYKSFALHEAVEVGKQLTYAIPVEKMLGVDLTLQKK